LFQGEEDLTSVFEGLKVEKRESCVTPINYNNSHWLALCCTPKHAYIFNSLNNLPSEKIVTALMSPLIAAIYKTVTDKENKLLRIKLPLNFPECGQQKNNKDCGTFVCGFRENITNETIDLLFEINIENIRKRCHQLR